MICELGHLQAQGARQYAVPPVGWNSRGGPGFGTGFNAQGAGDTYRELRNARVWICTRAALTDTT